MALGYHEFPRELSWAETFPSGSESKSWTLVQEHATPFFLCLCPWSDGMCCGPWFSCLLLCCQPTPLPGLRCGDLVVRTVPSRPPAWWTGLALAAQRAAPHSPTSAKRVHHSSTHPWPYEWLQDVLLQGFICAPTSPIHPGQFPP